MAVDRIPLAFGKSTGGAAIEIQELPVADQIGNQWLAMPSGYIEGLLLEWVSASSIRITSGACTVPGIGTLTYATAITKTGIALGNSVWGHIYAYSNAGSPDFEVLTTAPAAPYSGFSRAKTGDTTRRYIGSFKTDASGSIIPFIYEGYSTFRYLIGNNSSPLRCLANGKATARTSVSISSAIPVSAAGGVFLLSNTDSSVYANISIPFASAQSVIGIAPGGALAGQVVSFPTDASQNIDYYYSSLPTNGLFIDVVGFNLRR